MSDTDGRQFCTVAFADLDTGLWGAIWQGERPLVTVGSIEPGTASQFVDGVGNEALEHGEEGDAWTVVADGFDVTVSPCRDSVHCTAPDGFDQLCRVRGQVVLGGAERAIDMLGRRSKRHDVDLGRFDSLRDFSAWFAPDDAVALTALRPHRGTGHERDVVVASVFNPSGSLAVADPRLSTTYGADGAPVRAGLELWLTSPEDSEEQYPRRAAGEALGASATGVADALNLAAYPFRCHSRGNDGPGVYLVLRGV
jgi:hypothetical protein